MKINFTPDARLQFHLIQETPSIQNGFVVGQNIGKHLIIENIFPVNFNEKSIDSVYSLYYDEMGEKLAGVFFNNREPFLCDWFLEDIIIKITPQKQEVGVYLYDFEKKCISLMEAFESGLWGLSCKK